MSEKILVPTLGESVSEATVSKWLKKEGDKVLADEALLELETDKVNVEVPSPVNGFLETVSVNEGQTVNVGEVLGIIGLNKTTSQKSVKEVKSYSPPKKEIAPLILEREKIIPVDIKKEEEPLILTEPHLDEEVSSKNLTQVLSPAAKKMAAENKTNLENIKGTGKNGVVLKEDIMNLMGQKPLPSEKRITHGPEERIKMTRLRLTIAKRLKEAQENAAMLTTFNEIDMHEVILMKNNYKDEFQKKYSVKLGFMSFFVKACVIGLKNFPSINAEIQNDEMIYKNYYNISIAVGTERGLVVPVVKNTDEMSFADIEKNIADLGNKAREGKITIDDLQGGTFTITNGGIYGSMLSTPILNPPQSAVLGMHNIIERPVVVDGNIVIRPMMYLALSYDHRIIDGKEAVSFLKTIKESLEQPKRLFLNI
jgi:2-oxoglutarate dehydrogenase E2 component (dihydrolipoamide succinyltransferase)